MRNSLPYRTHVAWNSWDPRWKCGTNLGLPHLIPLSKTVRDLNCKRSNTCLSCDVEALLNDTSASKKLWYKSKDNFGTGQTLITFNSAIFENNKDSLIGIAIVALSSLVLTFPQICDWDTIDDFSRDAQGQIDVGIAPRDDLQKDTGWR